MGLQEDFNRLDQEDNSRRFLDHIDAGSVYIKRNTAGGFPELFPSLVMWVKVDDDWIGNFQSVDHLRRELQGKIASYSQALRDMEYYDEVSRDFEDQEY